jgi:hypothetical protein
MRKGDGERRRRRRRRRIVSTPRTGSRVAVLVLLGES